MKASTISPTSGRDHAVTPPGQWYSTAVARRRISARLNAAVALPVIALGVAAAFAMPIDAGIVIVTGGALIVRLATSALYYWPGGVTEWSIPAVGLLVEAFTLSYMQKGLSPIG